MLEQFFKSQVAAVSDPYQCNRITDALAAAGITEIFVDKENADMALHIVHTLK